MIQEELARNLVSMSNETLYATMTMAHSVFFWVTSLTPAVFENLSKASSVARSVPFWLGLDESATPGETGSEDEMGPPFSYHNAVDTIILLLTIWMYYKTISTVWRSISAVWETTVWILKILGFFTSKCRGFLQWIRNDSPQQDEEHVELVDDGIPSASSPSILSGAVPQANTNIAHGISAPHHAPPLSPPPQLQRALLYYYDPVTQKIMPWFPPQGTVRPPSQVQTEATMVGRSPVPPQEPVFAPVDENRTENTLGQNNNNNFNDKNPRMGNIHNEVSPVFERPRENNALENGDKATALATMGNPHKTTVLNQSDTNGNQLSVDSTANNPVVRNDAATENPVATVEIAVDNRANSKKRKYTSDDEIEATSTNKDQSKSSATPDTEYRRLLKKQKLEKARANARAWAEQTFGNTND